MSSRVCPEAFCRSKPTLPPDSTNPLSMSSVTVWLTTSAPAENARTAMPVPLLLAKEPHDLPPVLSIPPEGLTPLVVEVVMNQSALLVLLVGLTTHAPNPVPPLAPLKLPPMYAGSDALSEAPPLTT